MNIRSRLIIRFARKVEILFKLLRKVLSLHQEAKSSVIWDVHSYGASFQKILRPINVVFDDDI